jgi:hypothetical protein
MTPVIPSSNGVMREVMLLCEGFPVYDQRYIIEIQEYTILSGEVTSTIRWLLSLEVLTWLLSSVMIQCCTKTPMVAILTHKPVKMYLVKSHRVMIGSSLGRGEGISPMLQLIKTQKKACMLAWIVRPSSTALTIIEKPHPIDWQTRHCTTHFRYRHKPYYNKNT